MREALLNRNSIARRLAVAVILFSSAITLVISAIQLYQQYDEDVGRIYQRFDEIELTHLPVLVNSVWSLDGEQVQAQLQGLVNLQDIEHLVVTVDGRAKWQAGAADAKRLISKTLPLQRQYRGRVIEIGALQVSASLDSVLRRVWQQALGILVGNGVKTILVAMFMLAMFHRLVGRHLRALAAHTSHLELRTSGAAAFRLERPALARGRQDELDQLTSALNDLWARVVEARREHQNALVELKRSEGRYRSLLNLSSDWLWEQDAEHRFVYREGGELERMGLPPSTDLGKTRWELGFLNMTDADWAAHRAMLDRREPFRDLMLERRSPDGSINWAAISGEPVFDEHGTFVGYRGIGRRLTRQVAAEQALRRRERELREAQHLAKMGSFSVDLRTGRREWSDAMFEIYDFPRTEQPPTLQEIAEHLAPENRQTFLADANGTREGRDVEFSHRILRPDGTERWVDGRILVERNERGEPMGLLGVVRDITDLRRAEEAVRRSEERLRQVIAVYGIGIFEHDHVAETIYWSPDLRAHYGFDAEVVITVDKYLGSVHPEDRDRIAVAVAAAHDPLGNGRLDFEHRIARPDGGMRWLAVRAQTYFRGEGSDRKPARTVGAVVDVTAFKAAEEAVRESEARFRGFAAAASDWFFELDADCRYTYVSPSFSEQTGVAARILIGRDARALSRDQFPEGELDRFFVAFDRREPVRDVRFRWHIADKIDAWLSTSGVPHFDAHGRFAGYRASVSDITRQVAAERELRKSSERLRLVIDNAPVVLLELDKHGVFTLSEGKGLEALRRRAGEVVGISAFDMYRDRPAAQARIRRAISGETFSDQFDLDGRIMVGYYTPIRSASGEIDGSLGLMIDVTERADAEAELHRLNHELEERVRLRTSELQQALDELRSAQGEVVRSARLASLGAMVAGVAHELNTPLGNSVTLASMLAEHAAEAKTTPAGEQSAASAARFLRDSGEALDILQRNLARAVRLLGSFKQVAVDRTSEVRRAFELDATVREIVETMSPMFSRTPHRLALELAAGVVLESYPGALSQVLTNLVGNALTHGMEGRAEPGTIRVSTRVVNDGVELTVADDGRGIPPDHMERIFDPFFTTRLGQGGSGLGLHLVYSLVTEVLGGTVRARNLPGGGAEFAVLLPRGRTEAVL